MPGPHEPDASGAAASRESRSTEEPTVLVRKLGSARVPTYLERVLTEGGEHRFIVVERQPRGTMTEQEASESMRDARMAAALEHPNVVRTRAITLRRNEISVTSDYVAGERLSELWSGASRSMPPLPLEIALRILVDVSTGLGALHKLRGTEGHERVKFVHGEVTAENVLVGLDGVSSVLRAAHVRSRIVPPRTGIGTLAPEVLSGMTADPRADVYSVGALLWQALSGKPLFPDDDVAAILAVTGGGTVARAVVKGNAAWALPLADVAARALAPIADQRFPTTSSMLTELRKIAGPKLATAADVATFVEMVAGEKIAARLAGLQASAVIRKATSIPAPGPSLAEEPAVERSSAASKLATQEGETNESKLSPIAVATPIEAPTVVATETTPLSAEVSPKTTPPLAEVPPKTETLARTRVVPPAPVPETPPAQIAPSPLAQRPVVRSAMGVWLAIALLTGLLALLAVRSRQVIVTPGAALLNASTMPAPVSSAVPDEVVLGARRPGVVSDPLAGATSPAKGRPASPAAPHGAPAPKARPK